jgi:arginyl-tRNA--protein-N-Asp/Glu arginylyltransferase
MINKNDKEDIVFVDDEDEDSIDVNEFETICEHRDIWSFDEDTDAFWAQGWTSSAGEFWRDDSVSYEDRLVRVFPTRCRLKDFVLSKSLRRVLKRNSDLKTIIRPIRITPGKSALFKKHSVRFNEEPYGTIAECYKYADCFPSKVMELCVLQNRKLVACSIFQVAGKSVYSNTAFWDLNETRRSLGTLTVLLEMQYAIRKKKDFYYLGHYYKANPNYEYKKRFPALEFYDWDNDCWIDKKDAGELLNKKFRRIEVLPPFKIQDLLWLIPCPTQTLFPEIAAIAMFGSQAHGTARPDSDIDVLILTPDIQKHFEDNHYARCFGSFRYARREKWFSGETLRSFFRQENGQIEYNFATPDWADLPANAEARRIVKDGIKILHDPHGILEKLQKSVLGVV